MAKINVRDRNKNQPDRKPNWEYRFEAAKVKGKRHHISKAGFRTKKDALAAGVKALAEYNNAGLHFEPSEIGFNDYISVKSNNKHPTEERLVDVTNIKCVHTVKKAWTSGGQIKL